MNKTISDRLLEIQGSAFHEAEIELKEREFSRDEERKWRGVLECAEFGPIEVRILLPETFPDSIPEIYVDRSSLFRRVPHVEKNGKVCLADKTGLLIDSGNPRGIVADAINRARNILIDGLSGENDDHFKEEFLAYWGDEAELVTSICNSSGQSRVIRKMHLKRESSEEETKSLLTDDLNFARSWATKTGWKAGRSEESFFVAIADSFPPPDFGEVLAVKGFFDLIRNNALPDDWRQLRDWLNKVSLPATIVMSLPLSLEKGRILIGIRLEEAKSKAKKQALKGFRPGKVPASRELLFCNNAPITKLAMLRMDTDYLLTRGGASSDLYSKTVVVIGCGAVGSNIVDHLASLGVGHLRLIDNESLSADNLHRHKLGANYIGCNKALGLKSELAKRLPHIEVEHREQPIEIVLQETPEFVTDASLILIALGDETLELRLNNLLRDTSPRIHAWVEPLGVGGHILSVGLRKGAGCFRCLFEHDLTHGITNKSAFAAAGQRFQRSLAGCSGSFTPFASLDADLTAIEAVKLASRILLDEEKENVLISWRGDSDDFVEAGFDLSPRGKMFKKGDKRRETGFHKQGCLDCGQ